VTALQRTRSSRCEALRASRAQRPSDHVHGTWRSRVRHQPDPGGGGGRPQESAPLVLLVDDERAIRTICRVNLEGEGLAVTEAGEGAEALEEVRRKRPCKELDLLVPIHGACLLLSGFGHHPNDGTSPFSRTGFGTRTARSLTSSSWVSRTVNPRPRRASIMCES